MIRSAGAADAAGILECLRLAFEPYRESYTPPAFADTVLSSETIEPRLAEMAVLVAVDAQGAIVGTVGWSLVSVDEGHIRGMAVRPDHLGKGVAQRLLETVECALRRHGCVRVTLDTTRPLTRAIHFYECNGYRSTGVVRDFFGMPIVEYAKALR
jgi:GNAT superfamily N-acetyltransferase